MGKHIALRSEFELNSFEKLNSEFTKVKILVAYHGKNRNGSNFSKEMLTKMAETSLKNVPIVGHWIEEEGNFGGHDGAWEESGNSFRYKDLTRPFGVVPSDTELSWEVRRENDGYTEHEYLTCTGILWSGRYPECEKTSSGFPYPYITKDLDGNSIVNNNEFTDDSTPSADLFNANIDKEYKLHKPVTNITRDKNKLISFDFMGGTSDIRGIMADGNPDDIEYYDIQGRKVAAPSHGIYIIRNKKTNKTYKSSFN